MGFREVPVFEVKEVLRLWLRGEGLRAIERLSRVDRKTVRRCVQAAVELGVDPGGGEGQLVSNVRPFFDQPPVEGWRRRTPRMAHQRGREDGNRERNMERCGPFDAASLHLAGARVGRRSGCSAC